MIDIIRDRVRELMNQAPVVKQTSKLVTTRKYEYHRNDCNLSFILTIDDDKELIDYTILLNKAIEDVVTDLNNLHKK